MRAVRPVILAYDVSDNKNRYQIFKILKQWRLGGQKSVCECRLTMAEASELVLQIVEHLDPKTDSLLLAWLEPYRPVLSRGIANIELRENSRHVG